MNSPPCVSVLKAKLNFSLNEVRKSDQWLKWCPNLVRKSAHLPPHPSGVRGSWPPRGFKYFTCNRLPPDTPGGKTSPRIPNSSCRLNTPPRERKGKAKDWQTGNASLASPPTHLTGPPLRASSTEEEYPTDGACSLQGKQTISESGAERKLLSIYKLTVPNTERCENRHYS